MDDATKPDIGPVGDFPKPKRQLLAESIADSVAEAVATRHLAPGERIVETALAARYGVSRVPVREALKILHTQGILTGGGHRGYRVSDFSHEKANQVSEVRLMLETYMLRDAIAKWRDGTSDTAGLEASLEEMRRASASTSFRQILHADLNFHRAIADASGNEVATALWKAIARHVLIIFNIARYRDIELDVVVTRHEALHTFIRSQIDNPGTVEELRAALDEHFLSRRSASAIKSE